MAEERLRVSGNRVLKEIYGPKRAEMTMLKKAA
jgi:hypothetical protein